MLGLKVIQTTDSYTFTDGKLQRCLMTVSKSGFRVERFALGQQLQA